MKISGTVLGLEHDEGVASPFLVLRLVGDAKREGKNRYKVYDEEMHKVVRRALATGDLIECDVTASSEIVSFRIIKQSIPDKGRVRTLQIVDHTIGLTLSDEQFEEPGEADVEILEAIKDGEVVFSLEWYADRPGGAGTDLVVRVGAMYFYDGDSGTFGPFRDMASALAWSELDTINSTFESISCTELTADGVAQLLTLGEDVSAGHEVQINGEIWHVCDQGRLVRAT